MRRRLLIDADIPVFRFAHVNQKAVAWDADTWTYWGDLGMAKAQLDEWLAGLQAMTQADEVTLFLSDTEANWRHDILPTYKGHRASWRPESHQGRTELPPPPGPQRPMLHKPLRQWLLDEREARFEHSLEADDLCGIAATTPDGTEKIIVSADKDLAQVPGFVYNPDKADQGVRPVSQAEGDYLHFYLTLVGDRTDGYAGCPGIGDVKARKLLDEDPTWPAVAAAFGAKGITADEALIQAQVARVLRHGDYNYDTKEIHPWQPTS